MWKRRACCSCLLAITPVRGFTARSHFSLARNRGVFASSTTTLGRWRRIGITKMTSSASSPPLIDVDCNLWHADLKPLLPSSGDGTNGDDDDLAAILKDDAIEQANIVAILSPSSTISEAATGLRFLEGYNDKELPRIRSTVGVHPYHVNDNENVDAMEQQLERAEQLISQHINHIAAVGECGLDASEGFPPLPDQIPWFQAQIDLANKLKLPLFVHERLAFDTTMELLSSLDVTDVPVLIHCFTGTPDECKAYVERGYYISLSGYVFKPTGSGSSASSSNGKKSDSSDDEPELVLPDNETLQCLCQGLIPLNRLMIETDAPYLGFSGCRDLYLTRHATALEALSGKKRKRIRNSTYPNLPSALPRVLDIVWQAFNEGQRLKGEPVVTRDELAWHTSQNANKFFQFQLSEERLKTR